MPEIPFDNSGEHPSWARRGARSVGGWFARRSAFFVLLLMLAGGAIARYVLADRDGHLFDVDLFLRWMRSLHQHGLAGFYLAEPGCNYPPLHLLTLRGLGWILNQLDPGLLHTDYLRGSLRIPACIADGLIAILLYVEARRLLGSRAGLAAVAVYYLNPVTLYNSAYWGQVDSIHSLFLLAALVALNRLRPAWAGLAIGLAVLQKLQSVALAPLVLLDVYRWKRWKGLAWFCGGLLLSAGLVLFPYVRTGALRPALERGYVRVVGQYDKLSCNAFNLWYVIANPSAPDEAVPHAFVKIATKGQLSVKDDAHWLLSFTWRRLGLGLFGLATACILTVYSRRFGPADRSLAAGLVVLAFFLFLTEMHERYAFPVVALLPIWAVGGAWRERGYALLSMAMLLNLTVAQPIGEVAGEISALHLLLLGLLALAMVAPMLSGRRLETEPAEISRVFESDVAAPPESVLVRWFRRVTIAALLAFVAAAGFVVFEYIRGRPTPATDAIFLSDLAPVTQTQGYGRPQRDRSIEGDAIHLADRYYLRGLGTHAPATLVYDIPEGASTFRALVGVNRHFEGRARVTVHLDGREVFKSDALDAKAAPAEIDVPVEGARRLKLGVYPAGANKGDHVDWAMARFEQ